MVILLWEGDVKHLFFYGVLAWLFLVPVYAAFFKANPAPQDAEQSGDKHAATGTRHDVTLIKQQLEKELT
jgi:hypothetical protein